MDGMKITEGGEEAEGEDPEETSSPHGDDDDQEEEEEAGRNGSKRSSKRSSLTHREGAVLMEPVRMPDLDAPQLEEIMRQFNERKLSMPEAP